MALNVCGERLCPHQQAVGRDASHKIYILTYAHFLIIKITLYLRKIELLRYLWDRR